MRRIDRKLTDAEVREIRRDAATRKAALLIRKHALEILHATPTIIEHAQRKGLSVATIKQAVGGVTYKDVAHPGPNHRLREMH